jgi:hypothetical protein
MFLVTLGDCLAFLAANALANDAHALALVGFRRIIAANLCRHGANELLVDPFDLELSSDR